MEVHQHTHTERKKWHHYFWEFFMLFLAVTLGFFVENQREHYIEHQREHNYILSLIADIKKDTSDLTINISRKKEKEKQMDSLFALLVSGNYKQRGSDTYFLGRRITTGIKFSNSDGTMQQLKSAGGLRLIRKQYVVDSIMAYDTFVKKILTINNIEWEVQHSFAERAADIFDATVFRQIIDSAGRSIRPAGNPQLLTNDHTMLNKIAMQVQYVWTTEKYNRINGEELKNRGIHLIAFLKKEYKLE